MARPRFVRGQDSTGRYYFSAIEKRQASGRAIRLYMVVSIEDDEVGTILLRLYHTYGNVNFKNMGPKKWTKHLEENLDKIIQGALKTFRKQYDNDSIELVAIEGWKIFEPRRIVVKEKCWLVADATKDSDPGPYADPNYRFRAKANNA